MEAKELQIGDWVYYYNKPYHVIGIRQGFGNKSKYKVELDDDIDRIASIESVQPIPLTREILRLNGFHITLDDAVLHSKNKYFIQYIGDENLLKIHLMRTQIFINVVVEYVHKFQHILRDCELYDLANNFKVE